MSFRMRFSATTAAAMIAAVLPHAASAQAFSVGVRASTLGIGGEATYRLSPSLALRGGYNGLSFTRTEDIEGIRYDVNPSLSNGTAFLDLHPFQSAFRLSGGVVYNKNFVAITAMPTQPIEIGDRTYQPSEIGHLDGRIDVKKKYSPYAGLGFEGSGRVAVTFDLGVVFHGTPQTTLTGTTPLTGAEKTQFDVEVAKERDEIQASIDDQSWAKYWPVLAFGLKIRL